VANANISSAIHRLQAAVGEGKDPFLFEMTLTAAAVIKLLFHSGNVRRVLFLVDRLELEDRQEDLRRSAVRRSSDGHLQGDRNSWQRRRVSPRRWMNRGSTPFGM
jgi:type I restriction enzyme, R subunit